MIENEIVIVMGPKTALARTLIPMIEMSGTELFLVARDDEDERYLKKSFHGNMILKSGEKLDRIRGTETNVTVYCCALGIIHPKAPSFHEDCDRLKKEIDFLDRLSGVGGARRLHIVFVSSVLTFNPSSEKNLYYAGMKNIVRSLLIAMKDVHPKTSISFLFPGRLLNKRSLDKPGSLFATTYTALARKMLILARKRVERTSIIGFDARLWLMFHGLNLMIKGFCG